jgi:type II restriction enzyme
MNIKNLIELYEEKKKVYGNEAYKHISEVFESAEPIHRNDWSKNPTKKQEHGQSWRAWKGKNYEKLVLYIVRREVEGLGLRIINGATLEKKKPRNLTMEESKIKRNVSVDFGEFGLHLPDVDLIVYQPQSCEVVAVISGKTSLRERIAQTGYWKIKLNEAQITSHIKVFFITTDEDGTLTSKKNAKKGRAIVETDTDGAYVMSQSPVEKSSRVKMFDEFIDDLKLLQQKIAR